MKLSVEPGDARVDMPLSLRVSDAGPRADVKLTVETTDAGGERWRSQAVYRADAAGAVDVARSPALSGTYKGVDGQGPLWSMRFAGAKGSVPRAFQFPATDLCLAVRADSGPGEDAGATVTRRVTAPSVTRTQHAGDGFAAVVFAPAGTGPVPAVAVLPGSTGARAVEPMAAFLASHGFLAMVVAYMEEPGLPPTLREVPLEALAAGVRDLAGHPRAAGGRVGVFSVSVGTGGALSLLARIPGLPVDAIVAVSPTSVVWQALTAGPPQKVSGWTLDGQPLPWVPMRAEALMLGFAAGQIVSRLAGLAARVLPAGLAPPGSLLTPALRTRPAYAGGLRNRSAVEAAAIPVADITCPMMLLAGEADEAWPAAEMARDIHRRRDRAGRAAADEVVVFGEAGHFLRLPGMATTVTWTDSLRSGGTPPATAAAQRESWARIPQFLHRHLDRAGHSV